MIESRLYFDIFNLNIVSCFYNPKLNIWDDLVSFYLFVYWLFVNQSD